MRDGLPCAPVLEAYLRRGSSDTDVADILSRMLRDTQVRLSNKSPSSILLFFFSLRINRD